MKIFIKLALMLDLLELLFFRPRISTPPPTFNVFHESSPNLSYYCVSFESCISDVLILVASAFPVIFIQTTESQPYWIFFIILWCGISLSIVIFPYYLYTKSMWNEGERLLSVGSAIQQEQLRGGFSVDCRVIFCLKLCKYLRINLSSYVNPLWVFKSVWY